MNKLINTGKFQFLFGGLILFLLLISYLLELPKMMNYLQVGKFWQFSLCIGALIGIGIAVVAVRRLKEKVKDVVSLMQLSTAIFFGSLLLVPLFVSWSNRIGLGDHTIVATEVILESEQARYSSRFGNTKGNTTPNQFLLFFFLDGRLYRTNGKTPFFPDAEPGDSLMLPIQSGRLGYQWVVLD